jgi:hypothetical protein
MMEKKSEDFTQVVAHALNAISNASIIIEPFPHVAVDNILPESYYAQLLKHLPGVAEIEMTSGFGHMKLESGDQAFQRIGDDRRSFWRRFEKEVKTPVCRILIEMMQPFVSSKMEQLFGGAAKKVLADPVSFQIQRGIIQCRARGMDMQPHLDKATNLFSYLFYLSDDPAFKPFGTTLYEVERRSELVKAYRERAGVRVWFPDPKEFKIKKSKTLEFQGNRLVAFVNYAHSLHGVYTGADAPRFAMQNYCELPIDTALAHFSDWQDPLSPDGYFHGGA